MQPSSHWGFSQTGLLEFTVFGTTCKGGAAPVLTSAPSFTPAIQTICREWMQQRNLMNLEARRLLWRKLCQAPNPPCSCAVLRWSQDLRGIFLVYHVAGPWSWTSMRTASPQDGQVFTVPSNRKGWEQQNLNQNALAVILEWFLQLLLAPGVGCAWELKTRFDLE